MLGHIFNEKECNWLVVVIVCHHNKCVDILTFSSQSTYMYIGIIFASVLGGINLCSYQKLSLSAPFLMFFTWKQLKSMVLDCIGKIPGLWVRFQSQCCSELVKKHGPFEFVHLRVNSILLQWMQFCWKCFDMLPNDCKAGKTVLQMIM